MRLIKILVILTFLVASCSKDHSVNPINETADSNGDDDSKNEDEQGSDDQNVETPPPVNNAPGAFNLLSFTNIQENVELINPEFSWEEAIDPEGDLVVYSLLLDMDNESPNTIIAENLLETSFLWETTLPRNTHYSWQVIATDSQGATTSSDVHSFITKTLTVTKLTSEAEFDGREEHTSVLFNNRIWIIGGVDKYEPANDIWSSEDGVNWTKETNNAGFISRATHASIVFNNKIWVVAGIDNLGNLLNDVWSSTDGINWVQENMNPPFATRANHTLTVYNNKMWLIGGQDSGYEFNDIWSSEDGINWVQETEDAGFPNRHSHTTVVFNNRLYVIAGMNSNQGSGFGELNDVWSSIDGKNWDIETVDADFLPRYSHSSVTYDNAMWVFGGLRKNDLWSSKDGVNWTNEIYQIDSQDIFAGRSSHTMVTFNNQILLIGGYAMGRNNDVWSIK